MLRQALADSLVDRSLLSQAGLLSGVDGADAVLAGAAAQEAEDAGEVEAEAPSTIARPARRRPSAKSSSSAAVSSANDGGAAAGGADEEALALASISRHFDLDGGPFPSSSSIAAGPLDNSFSSARGGSSSSSHAPRGKSAAVFADDDDDGDASMDLSGASANRNAADDVSFGFTSPLGHVAAGGGGGRLAPYTDIHDDADDVSGDASTLSVATSGAGGIGSRIINSSFSQAASAAVSFARGLLPSFPPLGGAPGAGTTGSGTTGVTGRTGALDLSGPLSDGQASESAMDMPGPADDQGEGDDI